MQALISQGKVWQLEEVCFPVAPPLTWVDLTAVTPLPQVGWSYLNGVFAAPVPTKDELTAQLTEAAEAKNLAVLLGESTTAIQATIDGLVSQIKAMD